MDLGIADPQKAPGMAGKGFGTFPQRPIPRQGISGIDGKSGPNPMSKVTAGIATEVRIKTGGKKISLQGFPTGVGTKGEKLF